MKLLKCVFCYGEVEILNNDRSINKKTRCTKCGFTNASLPEPTNKAPEIIIMRRRPLS